METKINANIKEEEVAEKDVDLHFRHTFKHIAGNDSEVSALELQRILNTTVSQRTDLRTRGFSMETCRHIISLMDKDGNGKLGLVEFHKCWIKLQRYVDIFRKHDMDKSGTMSSHEMREALREAGFQLNTPVLDVIVMRFADNQSAIDFDSFVGCVVRLELLFFMFKRFDKKNTGKIELDILQWLCLALS